MLLLLCEFWSPREPGFIDTPLLAKMAPNNVTTTEFHTVPDDVCGMYSVRGPRFENVILVALDSRCVMVAAFRVSGHAWQARGLHAVRPVGRPDRHHR